MWIVRAAFSTVIPAQAGIQDCKSALVALDPGFRRDDEKRELPSPIVSPSGGRG
jgi:hypothetical protein